MVQILILGSFLLGSAWAAWGGQGDIAPEEVVTVLPKDAIPAISNPQFVGGVDPGAQMAREERVLGLSLNGDHRAYPIVVLSVHEIVNDVVGGIPVAVTW